MDKVFKTEKITLEYLVWLTLTKQSFLSVTSFLLHPQSSLLSFLEPGRHMQFWLGVFTVCNVTETSVTPALYLPLSFIRAISSYTNKHSHVTTCTERNLLLGKRIPNNRIPNMKKLRKSMESNHFATELMYQYLGTQAHVCARNKKKKTENRLDKKYNPTPL